MAGESTEIEQFDLRELHRAATEDVVAALRLRCFEADGALVSVAGARPASAIVFNRTVGMGPEADLAHLIPRITTAYREAGVERFLVSLEAEADGEASRTLLAAHGLAPARNWLRFSCGTEPVPLVRTDLDVREVGAEHARPFAEIVGDAFDLGRVAVPWLEAAPGVADWHVFMAW